MRFAFATNLPVLILKNTHHYEVIIPVVPIITVPLQSFAPKSDALPCASLSPTIMVRSELVLLSGVPYRSGRGSPGHCTIAGYTEDPPPPMASDKLCYLIKKRFSRANCSNQTLFIRSRFLALYSSSSRIPS